MMYAIRFFRYYVIRHNRDCPKTIHVIVTSSETTWDVFKQVAGEIVDVKLL